MPIFICNKCGCVESTACSGYWVQKHLYKTDPLCSECNPEIKKWHNRFKKEKPKDGYLVDVEGFLYHPEDTTHHTTIVGEIKSGNIIYYKKE